MATRASSTPRARLQAMASAQLIIAFFKAL